MEATFYFGDFDSDLWETASYAFINDVAESAGISTDQVTINEAISNVDSSTSTGARRLQASSCDATAASCLSVDTSILWQTNDINTGASPDDFALTVMNDPSKIFENSQSYALSVATVATGRIMSSGGITVSTPSYPPPPPLPPPPPPACNVDPCFPGVDCANSEVTDEAPFGWTCMGCPSGYEGDSVGDFGCEDINECVVTWNGGCDNSTSCINEVGGFYCTPCPSGTSGTGLVGCTDDNECLIANGGCDFNVECINTLGSNECGDCPDGYTGTGAEGCKDVNECLVDNGGCDPVTECINVPGTVYCGTCPFGYVGDGYIGCRYSMSCEDNGEEGWTFPCAMPEIQCDDSTGFVECGDCPAGYSGTGITSCVDADGCANSPCFYQHDELMVECIDIPAPNVGFDCFSLCGTNPYDPENCCPDGYVGDGMVCYRDICLSGEACHPKSAFCAMIPGGLAECGLCQTGYIGDGFLDGTSCSDVDECATGNGGCFYLGECINTEGSYHCGDCPAGYRGNGIVCTIPTSSCAESNGGCFKDGDVEAECFDLDTDGITRVEPYCGSCPSGFDGDGITCEDAPGCFEGACMNECLDVPAPGTGFTCAACPAGFLGDGYGNKSGIPDAIGCYANKCFNNNGGCSDLVTCTNDRTTEAGRVCGPCTTGYRDVYLDGTQCVDQEGCHPTYGEMCFPGVVCIDVPAPGIGRQCQACPVGYSGDGETCVDVDECATNYGGCYRNGTVVTTCTNMLRDAENPKGRVCGPCPEGYKGSGETRCNLISTCAVNNGGCWQGQGDEAWATTNCTDVPGVGTDCGACPPGFSGTGESGCVDVDGCAEDPCFDGVTCTDVRAPGTGHTCTYEGVDWRCPEGFKGDGMVCDVCVMISSIVDSTITAGTTNRIGYDQGKRVQVIGKLDGLDSPNCTNIRGTKFTWTGTNSNGQQLQLTDDRNKANTLVLNLPKADLEVKLSYAVFMTSYLVGNTYVQAKSALEFYVASLPLVARITGGNMVTGEDNELTLSAAASYDPDGNPLPMTYIWKCSRDDGLDLCRFRPEEGQSDEEATPFASSYTNETIVFTLQGSITGLNYTFTSIITKGERSTTKQTKLTIFRGKPPVPVITPLADDKANPTSLLTLTSVVYSDDPEYLNTAWSAECRSAGADGACAEVFMNSTHLMTPMDTEDLVLRANVLSPGAVYVFTLQAVDRIGPASAEVEVEVNTGPSGGNIMVTPLNGTMTETVFTIKALGWEDEDMPIQYQMSYRPKGTTAWINLINDFTPMPAPPMITSMIPDPGLEAEDWVVEVRVACADSLGAQSYAIEEVKVFEAEVLDTGSLTADATFTLSNGDTDAAMRLVKAVSSALNQDAYEYHNVTDTNTSTTYYNATDGYYYVVHEADEEASGQRRLLAEELPVEVAHHRHLLAVPRWAPARQRNLLQARVAPPPRRHLLQTNGGNVTEEDKAAQRATMMSVVSATGDMLYATVASTDTMAMSCMEVVGVPTELSNETQQQAMGLFGTLLTNTQDSGNEASLSADSASTITSGLSNLNEAVPANGTDASSDSANRTGEALGLMKSMGQSLLMGAVAGMDASEVSSPTLAMLAQRDRVDSNSSRLYGGPITSPGSSSGVKFPSTFGMALQGFDVSSNLTSPNTTMPIANLARQSADLSLVTTATDAHFYAAPVYDNSTNSSWVDPEPTVVEYLDYSVKYYQQLSKYASESVTDRAVLRAEVYRNTDGEDGSYAALLSLIEEASAAGAAPEFNIYEFVAGPDGSVGLPDSDSDEARAGGLPSGSGSVSIGMKNEAGDEIPVFGLEEGMNITLNLAEGMYGTPLEIEARGLAWEGKAECTYWDEAREAYSTEGCASFPNPTPAGMVVQWKSLYFSDFSYDLKKAWKVENEEAWLGDCEEVWDGVLEGWNGTDAGYRKYLNYIGGENETWIETPECPITNPNSTAGCFWNWTNQSFIGDGCEVNNVQVCLCNHLTDFKVEVNPSLDDASPPTLASAPSPASLSLADILGSIVLLAIAGGIIGGACWAAVTMNRGDMEARREKLMELITVFGTGTFCYSSLQGTWTWSIFEEERMAKVQKSSAKLKRDKRKSRKVKKESYLMRSGTRKSQAQLERSNKSKRHMALRFGMIAEEEVVGKTDEELKYIVFSEWLDLARRDSSSDTSSSGSCASSDLWSSEEGSEEDGDEAQMEFVPGAGQVLQLTTDAANSGPSVKLTAPSPGSRPGSAQSSRPASAAGGRTSSSQGPAPAPLAVTRYPAAESPQSLTAQFQHIQKLKADAVAPAVKPMSSLLTPPPAAASALKEGAEPFAGVVPGAGPVAEGHDNPTGHLARSLREQHHTLHGQASSELAIGGLMDAATAMFDRASSRPSSASSRPSSALSVNTEHGKAKLAPPPAKPLPPGRAEGPAKGPAGKKLKTVQKTVAGRDPHAHEAVRAVVQPAAVELSKPLALPTPQETEVRVQALLQRSPEAAHPELPAPQTSQELATWQSSQNLSPQTSQELATGQSSQKLSQQRMKERMQAPEALQQEPSQKPMLKRMDQHVRAPAAAAAELVQMYEDGSGRPRQLGEDACAFDELEKAEDGVNWFRGFRPIPITREELEERDNAKLGSMLAKMRPDEGTSTMVDGERSSSDEGEEAFGMSDSEDDEAEGGAETVGLLTGAPSQTGGSRRNSIDEALPAPSDAPGTIEGEYQEQYDREYAIQAALAPPLLWDREEEEQQLRLATPPSGNGSRTGTPDTPGDGLRLVTPPSTAVSCGEGTPQPKAPSAIMFAQVPYAGSRSSSRARSRTGAPSPALSERSGARTPGQQALLGVLTTVDEQGQEQPADLSEAPETRQLQNTLLDEDLPEEERKRLEEALPQRTQVTFDTYNKRKREMNRRLKHLEQAQQQAEELGGVGRVVAQKDVEKFTKQMVGEYHKMKHKEVDKVQVDDEVVGHRVSRRVRRIMALKIKCFAQFVVMVEEWQDTHATDRLCKNLGLSLTAVQICVPMEELRAMSVAHAAKLKGKAQQFGHGSMLDDVQKQTRTGSRFAGSIVVDRSLAQKQHKHYKGLVNHEEEEEPERKVNPDECRVERLMGTALVLAYIDIHHMISRDQQEYQLEKAKKLSWQYPNGRPFQWYVDVFKVFLTQSKKPRGWYYRTVLWNLVWLQNTDGSFEQTPALATVLHAGDTSEFLSSQADVELDVELMEESIPEQMRDLVLDEHLLRRLWATMLAVERYKRLPFAWTINPNDPLSEQRKMHHLSLQWISTVSEEIENFTLDLLDKFQEEARKLVEQWNSDRLEAISNLRDDTWARKKEMEADMTDEEWRQRRRDRNKELAFMIMTSHPWMAVYFGKCTDIFTRGQRTLVLATSMLLMLFTTLFFFHNRGVLCCDGYKEHLGCDLAEATCWGSASCEGLYDMQRNKEFPKWMYTEPTEGSYNTWNDPDDYTCEEFPDPDNLMHKVWVLALTLAVQLPMKIFFTMLFTLGGTPYLPKFWTNSKNHKKLVASSSKATRVELFVYFVLTFLLDTQRLSRAMARYFLVLAMVAYRSMDGVVRFWHWMKAAHGRNMHTVRFLWATRVKGRNAHFVFQEMEAESAMMQEARLAALSAENTFEVVTAHMESLLLQCGYLALGASWVTILIYLLTYSVTIRDVLGAEAESTVLVSWVLSLLMDQFGIHVAKTFATKLLVSTIMAKLQERAKGEAGLVTWYEMYITKHLQAHYLLADEQDRMGTDGAMYDTGATGVVDGLF
ncbi:hypothetical protein CYMTET_34070 [Cymbomonas tetramitiformis]|uniref:EGF-like domain-containing protein n=1 Tax=Cymbomonas tetramitiformis TaxID=36881 RepID=A0AAE0KQK4_9CHLO|nr:hypothetical protein CYMTET_34070 [Cymbomonas tetramitiformis]